ncbi:MAG: ANTAR domain-containing protein [Lachnospiraceae bacterium]|nr:ANTAR domain-containing protein [Lachnospiraceae bacterium]
MSLKERIYSILIVSAADSFTSAFAGLLPGTRYSPIHTAASVSSARRILAEKTFDFVIINAPLPDDAGTRFAIDTCTSKQSAVLLLVKSDIHAGIHDTAAEYGVFTLPKPTSKPTMIHALNWMESARERLRQFENKSLSIEEKMAEIRLVNKAKWILISELKMNEPEAHRYIEKQAMDRCAAKRTIAEEIVKTYRHSGQ